MMHRDRATHLGSRRVWTLALALAACGDADDAVERAEPSDGGAPLLDAALFGEYEARGTIVDDPDSGPVDGARVCIATHPEIPCAVTDPSGRYSMRLPVRTAPEKFAVYVTAEGHFGFVGMEQQLPFYDAREGTASAYWFSQIGVRRVAGVTEELRAGGITMLSPNRALVLVGVWKGSGGVPVDERVALQPASGAKAIYYSASRSYDASLTALTETGYMMFVDVPPGRFEVAVSNCKPLQNLVGIWRGSTSETISGLAIAGAITQVTVICQR